MRIGRPLGSVDRHGRCHRVDLIRMRRTSWRSFCLAFGHRLSQLLDERDIAATELAAAIDVSVMTVFAWRRGRSVPGSLMLAGIAAAIGCSVVDLLPEQAHEIGGVL
jgi:hypothetical protein